MKEILDSLDKWTLIKLIGGITIFISSIVSFIAYFIKDYFINIWKSQQQKEIEELKAQGNQNNLIINNLTDSLSKIYLSSNEKRVTYLEKAWSGMIEIKKQIPPLVFMSYTILTKEELINLPNSENKYVKQGIISFKPDDYFNLIQSISNDIEDIRPFIGERLWTIFSIYKLFIGRLTYLLKDGIEKGTVRYWKDDTNFTDQVLMKVIRPEEIKQLFENDFTSFQNALNFLEYKALNEIAEHVTGKRMTEETVKQAIELSKITKNAMTQ